MTRRGIGFDKACRLQRLCIAHNQAPMAADDPKPKSASMATSLFRGNAARIRPLGGGGPRLFDAYHQLMRTTWPRLTLGFVAAFMAFNLLFACLYWLDPTGLANQPDMAAVPRFWRDFYFSVHTVATIGYGNVYPVSLYANNIVVIEITTGILFFALTTGIVFARFSRPTARILFSRKAVVREVDGVPTLMLRAANQRHNLIFSASVRLAILVDTDLAGTRMRRFIDLEPVRESNPIFALTWTIMHTIGPNSPLAGWIAAGAIPPDAELVVILSGFDESSGQTIYGRWAYSGGDIVWGGRLVDIIGSDPDGTRTIDYDRFHEVET